MFSYVHNENEYGRTLYVASEHGDNYNKAGDIGGGIAAVCD